MPAHNAPHDDPDMQRRGPVIPQTARDAKSVEDGDRPEEIAIVEAGAEVRPPNRNGSKISPEAVGPALLTLVLLNCIHNILYCE